MKTNFILFVIIGVFFLIACEPSPTISDIDLSTPIMITDLILNPELYAGKEVEVIGYILIFSDGRAMSQFPGNDWQLDFELPNQKRRRFVIPLSVPINANVDDLVITYAQQCSVKSKKIEHSLMRFTGIYHKSQGEIDKPGYSREHFEIRKITVNN